MDKIISILELLGENPTKFWKEDKIYCKLESLNPNLKFPQQKQKPVMKK